MENVTSTICLSLQQFGVAYSDRVVLSSIDLKVMTPAIMNIVGPSGTGKSTLLRTIAGFNEHIPTLRTWGSAFYRDADLSEANRPMLVSQNSRLLTSTLIENLLHGTAERFAATPEEKYERAQQILRALDLVSLSDSLYRPVVELPLVTQRLIAIARCVAEDPALLLIDEPTFGLADDDAKPILRLLRSQAECRSLIVVLHNQQQVKELGGATTLIAGGIVQETAPTDVFFQAACTEHAREFIATGTCSAPSPDANAADLSTGVRPKLRPLPANIPPPSESLGPRGFVWLKPGKLAGTPRPGVVVDIERDLEALKRVGVASLISLTMTPVDPAPLERYGIVAYWYPIPDMCAPSIETAREICHKIQCLTDHNHTVAVHCRAGLGRTGTILVAYLIWCGESAIQSLETARRFEPKWVQSQAQIDFLEQFAAALVGNRRDHAARSELVAT